MIPAPDLLLGFLVMPATASTETTVESGRHSQSIETETKVETEAPGRQRKKRESNGRQSQAKVTLLLLDA